MSADADPGADASTIVAGDVAVGDVLRSRDGTAFTVSRIEPFTMFGPPLIAFIEDSDEQWFKMPSMADAEVTLVSRA